MRPLVLVCDGCCSHYNDEIKKKVDLKVIFVLFTDNATHLIHPLDIAFLTIQVGVLKMCFGFHVREHY